MAWPKWKRSRRDPTLVYWRIAWRKGGRFVSVPAGTSRLPVGVDPMDRLPLLGPPGLEPGTNAL